MILTLDEVRQFVEWPTGAGTDDALQLLLDAAEADITERAGPAGPVTETVDGGWTTLILSRPILAVTSVTQDPDGTPLVLAADDYRYSTSGYVLHRLYTGTNPASTWPRTAVAYTVADDMAQRAAVQKALVQLAVKYNPGLVQQDIGDWSETYASNSVMNYASERAMILSTLPGASAPAMVVI